jgi:hypothetical protein
MMHLLYQLQAFCMHTICKLLLLQNAMLSFLAHVFCTTSQLLQELLFVTLNHHGIELFFHFFFDSFLFVGML